MLHTRVLLALAITGVAQAQEQAKIESPTPGFQTRFGGALALEGDRLVVGETGGGGGFGSVSVFTRAGNVWSPEGSALLPSDGVSGDYFGCSVDLDGTTLIVGSQWNDHGPIGLPFINNGAAYVYTLSGTTWTEEAKLLTTDAADFDWFGRRVAISGDTALIGVPFDDDLGLDSGSAFVYTRAGTVWTEEAKLLPSDGAFSDLFGWDVDLDGDTALIGSRGNDGLQNGAGAAYVFTRSGTLWSEQAKLLMSDGVDSDSAGAAVALSGDTALIGAVEADVAGEIDQGAAYVFTRVGTTWSEEAKLTAAAGDEFDLFGTSVDLDGDRAIIGASHSSSLPPAFVDVGRAFAFSRSGTMWTEDETLQGTDTISADFYGLSVAVSDSTQSYAVGASRKDDANSNVEAGAAYVHVEGFGIIPPNFYCTPKTSSAGCVSTISTSAPLSAPISGANDYSVIGVDVQGAKNGIFFFGTNGSGVFPFLGGTLCIVPPLGRTNIQFSGGSGATACDGSYTQIINDGVSLFDTGSGNAVWVQVWYRDPMNGAGTLGTSLSNAVELTFL